MKSSTRLDPRPGGRLTCQRTLTVALPALALTLPFSALAKRGGNGGGTTVTINPVPALLTVPPVTYTTTELHWSGDLNENGIPDDTEATFPGMVANGINNQGIVVGTAAGPDSPDPSLNQKRAAIVRLDPTSGDVVTLDAIFATALQGLNDSRPATEGPWRFAYGTRINDEGLIACRLIPANAPRRIERAEAIELGIEPTPCLYAVADLARSDAADALMLIPVSTSPDGDCYDLNELGDILINDHDPVTNTYLTRLFPLAENADGTLGYHIGNEIPIPAFASNSWLTHRQSINAAKEVIFQRDSQVVRYSGLVDQETVLAQGESNQSLLPSGISTDGTAFVTATEFVTTGKGRNQQTTRLDYPIHIISPTERTPLTDPAVDGNAQIPHVAWCASDAAAPGEAEVLIQLEGTLEHQIYKPNLGARFTVPVFGAVYWPTISSPVDQTVTTAWDPATGTGTYAAGFISYSLNEGGFYRGFVLEPQAP